MENETEHLNLDNEKQFADELDDFIVLEPMSQEEADKLMKERTEQLTKFYSRNKPYEISTWYDNLQKFTFKSHKIQLTSMDTYILHWMYYNDCNLIKMETEEQELYSHYLKLVGKIDCFLLNQCKQFAHQGQTQCFMKLATRSPKDLGYKYFQDQIDSAAMSLAEHLKNKFTHGDQMTEKISDEFVNQIYKVLLQWSKQKFKITNTLDFINIFSRSDRIIIDISDLSFLKEEVFSQFSKRQYERADEPFIELWAREWKSFQWCEELRCFYKNYQLTACTQYDQNCYFEELQGQQQIICKKITEFFELIKPSLEQVGLSQGVMDLVLFGASKRAEIEVKLIEINGFDRNSRASLFSWDKDIDILAGQTKNKVQLRLLTQPKKLSKHEVTHLMGMIEKGTQKIIEKAMEKLGLAQVWQQHK